MRRKNLLICISLLLAAVPGLGHAAPTDALELLPVLHSATPPGAWHTVPDGTAPVAARTIDGNIADWTGTSPRFAGTSVYSAGELIYTDHLFDAYGADDGVDADRVARLGPIQESVPQSYRVEPLFQANVPGEVGAPNPYPVKEQYGDAPLQSKADLTEVRLAADATNLYILARTAAMTTANDTALLVLADTTPGETTRAVPFNAGVSTSAGDVAVLLANGNGRAVDLTTATTTPVTVAANAGGYTNAIEASIPRALLERSDGTISLTIASGAYDGSAGFKTLSGLAANVANVAFRPTEPVRVWFDMQQALALHAKTIDPFFTTVDPAAMVVGTNERFVAGPGYYERVFTSSASISTEGGTEGIAQPYGVYLPPAYDSSTANVPMTWWFHWRGGKAHSAATMTPGFMRDMGAGLGGIVVSPRGRGTSSWYLGKGQLDFQEVWDDAMATFRVDRDRVYISGHSMGGWASYLFPILYPDRFAASFPVSPPVTQGAWTGLDFPGCDSYRTSDYTFCYVYANDSNPRVQHTYRLLENLRNVPIAIYAGGVDELVPVSGEVRQAERLTELGYRHRLYVFPTYEHYTPPIVDQWMEGARYFAAARRDPNPARVSYIRDMPFEHSVEIGPSQFSSPVSGLNFDFDHAYWMSGLTPANLTSGQAHIEARTGARADANLTVPEVGGPSAIGQSGPYTMDGLAWLPDPLASTALTNGFTVTLTGAVSVQLDTARMALSSATPITATVTTDRAATLRLTGSWPSAPAVTIGGAPVATTYTGGVLSIPLTTGMSALSIG